MHFGFDIIDVTGLTHLIVASCLASSSSSISSFVRPLATCSRKIHDAHVRWFPSPAFPTFAKSEGDGVRTGSPPAERGEAVSSAKTLRSHLASSGYLSRIKLLQERRDKPTAY